MLRNCRYIISCRSRAGAGPEPGLERGQDFREDDLSPKSAKCLHLWSTLGRILQKASSEHQTVELRLTFGTMCTVIDMDTRANGNASHLPQCLAIQNLAWFCEYPFCCYDESGHIKHLGPGAWSDDPRRKR